VRRRENWIEEPIDHLSHDASRAVVNGREEKSFGGAEPGRKHLGTFAVCEFGTPLREPTTLKQSCYEGGVGNTDIPSTGEPKQKIIVGQDLVVLIKSTMSPIAIKPKEPSLMANHTTEKQKAAEPIRVLDFTGPLGVRTAVKFGVHTEGCHISENEIRVTCSLNEVSHPS